MNAITNCTRRSVLRGGAGAVAYSAGAAAIAGGALAGAAKGASPQHISPSLSRLLDQYADADRAIDRWYASTWNPATEAHRAAAEAIPHTTIAVRGYRNVLDEDTPPHTYSTANPRDVARCKGIMSIPADLQSTDPRWQDTHRAARRLTIAAKWRERKLARVERQWKVLDLSAQEARLWQPIHAATDAILAFPVANALDLGAKLDHMEYVGTFESYPDKYQQIIRDDVRRLSSGEA